jgi:hypothetical protein
VRDKAVPEEGNTSLFFKNAKEQQRRNGMTVISKHEFWNYFRREVEKAGLVVALTSVTVPPLSEASSQIIQAETARAALVQWAIT